MLCLNPRIQAPPLVPAMPAAYINRPTCAAPSRCSRSPMSRAAAAGRCCPCGDEACSAKTANGRGRSDNAAAAVQGCRN